MLGSPAAGGLCRDSCGGIPVRYPLSIDDGCGSPYYRNMLTCADNATLRLRTPSGTYPVVGADYADPHLVVTDPSMWTCERPFTSVRAAPFSLDTSTRFSLSPRNDYLFFDCDEERVIVEPRPAVCDRYPERCDSTCDSAGYLCRNLPGCRGALEENNMSCCAYRPRAAESLRLMLRHCESYTSVYWRAVGDKFPPYDQVPAYGVRVDFEIPVTTRCLQCEDRRRGAGGTCGFDPVTRDFVCICNDARNSTTDCAGALAKFSPIQSVFIGQTSSYTMVLFGWNMVTVMVMKMIATSDYISVVPVHNIYYSDMSIRHHKRNYTPQPMIF